MSSAEEALYGNRNAAYDQAAKKVLSQKKILAFILKRMVEEFKDESVQDIMTKYIEGTPLISQVPVHPDETNQEYERIQGNNTEDGSISEGMVRYDILFQALVPKTKEPIMLIINIEAQDRANPGYSILKRATYYASRMVSSQRGRDFYGDDYDKIKKVYTIWICMNAPKDMGNFINRYRMVEERLHGKYRAEEWQYNLLNVVMLYLGNRKTQDSLIEMLRIKIRAFQRHSVLEALITRFTRAHKIPSASAGGIFFIKMRRKTPSFRAGDIRRVRRICVSN